eukprot:gene31122-6259_t
MAGSQHTIPVIRQVTTVHPSRPARRHALQDIHSGRHAGMHYRTPARPCTQSVRDRKPASQPGRKGREPGSQAGTRHHRKPASQAGHAGQCTRGSHSRQTGNAGGPPKTTSQAGSRHDGQQPARPATQAARQVQASQAGTQAFTTPLLALAYSKSYYSQANE